MNITITKKTTKKELKDILNQFREKTTSKKKSLLSVYGIFKFDEDPVTFQKKLRDEWD